MISNTAYHGSSSSAQLATEQIALKLSVWFQLTSFNSEMA